MKFIEIAVFVINLCKKESFYDAHMLRNYWSVSKKPRPIFQDPDHKCQDKNRKIPVSRSSPDQYRSLEDYISKQISKHTFISAQITYSQTQEIISNIT